MHLPVSGAGGLLQRRQTAFDHRPILDRDGRRGRFAGAQALAHLACLLRRPPTALCFRDRWIDRTVPGRRVRQQGELAFQFLRALAFCLLRLVRPRSVVRRGFTQLARSFGVWALSRLRRRLAPGEHRCELVDFGQVFA